jgi:hypothetical protein
MDTTDNTIEDFEEFIRRYEFPRQGTEEWYKLRRKNHSVGASSFHKVVRGSKSAICDLVKDRIFPRSFLGNIHTLWGSVFEDLVVIILEQKYGKVYQTGSVPGAVPFQRCSPDGFIIINGKIILIEIKCPTRRLPKKIPKHYEIQVLTCLDSISYTSHGLFIDALFRKSSTITGDDYDVEFHAKTYRDELWFSTNTKLERVYLSTFESKNFLNAGECSIECLEECLKKKHTFYDLTELAGQNLPSKVNNLILNYISRGVLPIKYFGRRERKVDKQVGFVKKYEDILLEVIRFTRELIDLPEHEKKDRLESYKHQDELLELIRENPSILS